MASIVPDPVSWTTLQIHMGFGPTDAILSTGTAFIYKSGDTKYIVTNWHNVTGRHPITGACLSETLAVPDTLVTYLRDRTQPAIGHCEALRLYRDEAMLEPAWYEHPAFGHDIDVVALPLNDDIVAKYRLFAINEIAFDDRCKTEVADDAFIVGYPFSEMTYAQLPIWKRASIASEPDIDLDRLPKVLVDTATRPGLSGSPVIMQRVGVHGFEGGILKDDTSIGRIRNFIGVYSGRIGADELKAQLGVVWKARVIDEIISARVYGEVAPEA